MLDSQVRKCHSTKRIKRIQRNDEHSRREEKKDGVRIGSSPSDIFVCGEARFLISPRSRQISGILIPLLAKLLVTANNVNGMIGVGGESEPL